MRRMKKARQYLLGIFAALLLCGIFSVNTVKADTQYVYDNASLLSDEEEQDLESYRRKKNRGAKGYADLKRVKIRDRRDALIDRHVSMHKIPRDDGNHGGGGSGGGGGGGGGSHVHTSASGNSHGGGSIGF